MKFLLFLPLFASAALLSGPAFGQGTPEFHPAQYLLSNGDPILSDNFHSAPAVLDWNGDGAKDLLIGTFYNGNIHFFANVGTDNDPVFSGSVMLEADGSVISVGYG